MKDVTNVLLRHGIKVVHAGRSKSFPRFIIGLFILPIAIIKKVVTGRLSARGLWYVLGFEDHVFGIKR